MNLAYSLFYFRDTVAWTDFRWFWHVSLQQATIACCFCFIHSKCQKKWKNHWYFDQNIWKLGWFFFVIEPLFVYHCDLVECFKFLVFFFWYFYSNWLIFMFYCWSLYDFYLNCCFNNRSHLDWVSFILDRFFFSEVFPIR